MQPHHLRHAVLQPIDEMEVRRVELPMPSWRGLLAGSLAVGLGLLILLLTSGAIVAGDLAVLGMLFVGAMVGGSAADRMVERRQAAEAPKGWMTVIVSSHGPSEMEAIETGPKVSPRHDPERRSLTRLARQRRREPVSSGM